MCFPDLGQSPIVGYLLAGMVLGGPGSLHAVRSQSEIEAIAELGVALLLFSLGLEFSINRLKQLGAKPLLGGAVQILLTITLAFVRRENIWIAIARIDRLWRDGCIEQHGGCLAHSERAR